MTEQESLSRYKWRFRNHALRAAVINGVNLSACVEVVDNLGTDLEVGPGVAVSNRHDMSAMPEGTVVRVGQVDDWRRLAVFRKRAGRWVWVLGGNVGQRLTDESGYTVTVVSFPDNDLQPPDWLAEEPDESTRREIAEFMQQAWAAGNELKEEMDWCSTYDNVMREFGLTSAAIRRAKATAQHDGVVNPGQAHELPLGTVLRIAPLRGGSKVVWYMRTDNPHNRAGTTRIFGFDANTGAEVRGNYYPRMEIVGLPSADGLGIPLVDRDLIWPHLPAGTTVNYSGSYYTICDDHQAIQGAEPRAVGMYPMSAFSEVTNMVIFSIPTPGLTA